MALSDKTQFDARIAVSPATLPTRFPPLPEEVLARFPRLTGWQNEQQRLLTRLREALETVSADVTLPLNTLQGRQDAADSRVSTLQTEVTTDLGVLSARIDTEEEARVDADSALATRATNLETSVNTPTTGLLARVSTIETAYVSADSALAIRATNLETSVNTPTTGLLARVTTVESTYATQTFAETKKSEAISAAAADATAKVSVESTARSNADGTVAARYTLSVDANGRVAGMVVGSSVNLAGTASSEIAFLADKFKVYNGTSSNVAPFSVEGGVVYMDNVVVRKELDIGTGDTRAHITSTAMTYGTRLKIWAPSSGFSSLTFNQGEALTKQIQLFGYSGGSEIQFGPNAIAVDVPNGYIRNDGNARFKSLTLYGTLDVSLATVTGLGSVATENTVPVSKGGTGATTLTGYVKGSGTSALTASSTIPNTDVTGLGSMATQSSSSVSISGGAVNGCTSTGFSFDGGNLMKIKWENPNIIAYVDGSKQGIIPNDVRLVWDSTYSEIRFYSGSGTLLRTLAADT